MQQTRAKELPPTPGFEPNAQSKMGQIPIKAEESQPTVT